MYPRNQAAAGRISAIKTGKVGNSAWGRSTFAHKGGNVSRLHLAAVTWPARRLKAALRRALLAAGISRDATELYVKHTHWTTLRDDPACLARTVQAAIQLRDED